MPTAAGANALRDDPECAPPGIDHALPSYRACL